MGKSILIGRYRNSESTSGNPMELKLGLIPAGTAREKEKNGAFAFVASLIGKIKDTARNILFERPPKIEAVETHYIKAEGESLTRCVEQDGKYVPMEKGAEIKEGINRLKERLNKSIGNQNKTR